ncbi:MAG: 50S ribosomal protein L4 [Hyphomicrobiales bacterium]|nr:50S ribosomal protein L4 [Hyphomicrobiales bacterium]
MQIDVLNAAGEVVAQQNLDETVWGIEPNIPVMHQALLRQQANARLGTHDTKTRAEVRGGGRKPWRQKGTGRARQGSIRAPQWAGGGVVFGPHPRTYTQSLPKQMRRLAIRSALSAKLRDDRVSVIQGLTEIEPKTKTMKALIEKLPASRSVLIVVADKNEVVDRAAGNLPNVRTLPAGYVNVRDVLKYERLVVTPEAIARIEELWALPEEKRTPSAFKQARLAAASAGAEKEA